MVYARLMKKIMHRVKSVNKKVNKSREIATVIVSGNTLTVQYMVAEHSHVKLNIYNSTNELVETIEDAFEEMEGCYKITYRLGNKYKGGEYILNLLINGKTVYTKNFNTPVPQFTQTYPALYSFL